MSGHERCWCCRIFADGRHDAEAARAAAGWHKIVAAGGGARGITWRPSVFRCCAALLARAARAQLSRRIIRRSFGLPHSFSPLAGLAVEPAMPVLGGVAQRPNPLDRAAGVLTMTPAKQRHRCQFWIVSAEGCSDPLVVPAGGVLREHAREAGMHCARNTVSCLRASATCLAWATTSGSCCATSVSTTPGWTPTVVIASAAAPSCSRFVASRIIAFAAWVRSPAGRRSSWRTAPSAARVLRSSAARIPRRANGVHRCVVGRFGFTVLGGELLGAVDGCRASFTGSEVCELLLQALG